MPIHHIPKGGFPMSLVKVLGWIFVVFLSAVPHGLAFPFWEKPPQPGTPTNLESLQLHPLLPAQVLVASRSEIFESTPGSGWLSVWRTPAKRIEIRKILSLDHSGAALVILTNDGAWMGDLAKKEWRKIFHGETPLEKSALAFTADPGAPEHWFIGTGAGLFESKDGGKTWRPVAHFAHNPVHLVSFIGRYLVAGSQKDLSLSENSSDFKTVFSLNDPGKEPDGDTDELPEDASPEESRAKPEVFRDLIAADDSIDRLWLATSRGVFYGSDKGQKWVLLPQSGLRSAEIKSLVFEPASRRLFSGTAKGVYVYEPARRHWREVFEGLENTDIRGLAILPGNKPALAAVTGGGFSRYFLPQEILIRTNPLELSPEKTVLFQMLIRLEPSFREFQEAVIRFHDVGQKKIDRWHFQSRLRAVVPTFYFSKSFSRNRSIDIDRGGTADPDKYMTGPDDLGRAWNMNVSWDLGDMIWSTAQTSIDSRSKLDAELRRDVLSETTRLYYERRRLQMQLVFRPSGSEEAHMADLIRLDELTSLLDTLSGGIFSDKLEKIYRQFPQMNRLWISEIS
jgi:hypothetical protein